VVAREREKLQLKTPPQRAAATGKKDKKEQRRKAAATQTKKSKLFKGEVLELRHLFFYSLRQPESFAWR